MEVATTYNAAERLEQVLAEIVSAAKLGRRLTADIDLIAVSKTRSAAEIAPLLEAGHRVFGENRVQEAADKWPEMKAVYHSVELHLVGQLQSNKAGEAVALFDAIHSVDRLSLISALGKAKPGATVYAYASTDDNLVTNPTPPQLDAMAPLLVGHQIGDGDRGRVLAFGAMDTMTWQRLGLPATADGKKLHARFWKQLVLWLAHQDVDDGAAFARPEFPRVAVGNKQGIKIGLRGPNGGAVTDAKFEVKVFGPNETEATAKAQAVVIDPTGGNKVNYLPTGPGEYTVKLVASGKTTDGKEAKGEASAKFLSYAEVSEEMVRTAADPEFLEKLATSGGGRAYRLDDLAGYLKDLKGQPLAAVKPKPRYLPSWEPKWDHRFLPTWLVAFAVLLGLEWGLRRWWGMV